MSPKSFLYPQDKGKSKDLYKNYLLLENGRKIQLEDSSDFLLLENQTEGTVSDWKMRRDRRI